ncbi:MAG: hypothetical protein ACKVH0_06480 [Alphaproteobacteria bacterium]
MTEKRQSGSLFASRRAVIGLVMALFVASGFWAATAWTDAKTVQENRATMQAHSALLPLMMSQRTFRR